MYFSCPVPLAFLISRDVFALIVTGRQGVALGRVGSAVQSTKVDFLYVESPRVARGPCLL